MRYNERHHQTQLVNTWVSKASATQRAGRTGRVRPGNVWRLYSQALFDAFTEHEQAEIHRQPLDATQEAPLTIRKAAMEAYDLMLAKASSLCAQVAGVPDLRPLANFLRAKAKRNTPTAASLVAMAEGGWTTQAQLNSRG